MKAKTKKKSWRTTLGGILAAAGLGMRAHPATVAWADLVAALGVAFLGAAARDNSVTSEDAGARPGPREGN